MLFQGAGDYNSMVASSTKQTRLNSNKLVTLSIVDPLWPLEQRLLVFIDGRQEGGTRKTESKGRRETRSTQQNMEEEIMPLS